MCTYTGLKVHGVLATNITDNVKLSVLRDHSENITGVDAITTISQRGWGADSAKY